MLPSLVRLLPMPATFGYVGDNGTILRTTNGGTSWTAQTSGTNQNLNDIFFAHPSGYGGANWEGTSMAAPAVSGIVGLMLEAYNNIYKADPLPSTMKGVLIQTAEDRGNPGPDFKYGYGHVDALASVNLITPTTSSVSNHMREGSITNGLSTTYTINSATAITPKCTLVWDDKEGTAGAAKVLVNDLDLRLVDSGNVTHQPWVLDPTSGNQNNNATRGDNTRDNVEQVIATAAKSGQWTVQVIGDSVPQGPQTYSLICSHTISGGSSNVYLPMIIK